MNLYPPGQEYQPQAETVLEAGVLVAAYAAVDANLSYRLIAADFAPVPGIAIADLTEATYTGYALKELALTTFDNVQHEPDGSVRVGSTSLLTWAGPTAGPSATIFGYYVVDGGPGTRLYRVVHFNAPIVLADDTQFLNIIPVLSFTGGYMAQ